MSEATEHPLERLRAAFPAHQISKLPKALKKDSPKGRCKPRSEGGDAPDWQDHYCGGYHGLPAVHLDYVGHAALTDRLLDTDPAWFWEPVALNADGLPAFDRNGGLWIRLTVAGVTRLGYGCADGKSGGDAIKEVIGDALRNAAMRFGAALDLWHKGDLHVEPDDEPKGRSKPKPDDPPNNVPISDDSRDLIATLAEAAGKPIKDICAAYHVESLKDLTAKQGEATIKRLQSLAREPVQ